VCEKLEIVNKGSNPFLGC